VKSDFETCNALFSAFNGISMRGKHMQAHTIIRQMSIDCIFVRFGRKKISFLEYMKVISRVILMD